MINDSPGCASRAWLASRRASDRPMPRPRCIGRSLARRLASHAREAHPGLSLITLRVLPGNDAAVRAYLGAGFVRVDHATESAWNSGQPTAWWWMQLV